MRNRREPVVAFPSCDQANTVIREVRRAMTRDVRTDPLALLRGAVVNLAAESSEQEARLRGAVIQDELALDFENAFASIASLPERNMLDDGIMIELEALGDKLSAMPEDSLWAENLNSLGWAEIRSLAARLVDRL